MTAKNETGLTIYGEMIEGEERNYYRVVRFDVTDGFLGITQFVDGGQSERVLLSPRQVAELRKWLR